MAIKLKNLSTRLYDQWQGVLCAESGSKPDLLVFKIRKMRAAISVTMHRKLENKAKINIAPPNKRIELAVVKFFKSYHIVGSASQCVFSHLVINGRVIQLQD